jgi:hypothetical protein
VERLIQPLSLSRFTGRNAVSGKLSHTEAAMVLKIKQFYKTRKAGVCTRGSKQIRFPNLLPPNNLTQ